MVKRNLFMSPAEMKEFDDMLETNILKDTLRVWELTRIDGMSASLVMDGNISIALLHAFDEIRTITLTTNQGWPRKE